MDAPRMSACIVAYCDYEEVCAAVRSVLTHTPAADFRLFVVDNASPDGCGARLAAEGFRRRARDRALPALYVYLLAKGTTVCCPTWRPWAARCTLS